MGNIKWIQKIGVWEANDTTVTLITGVEGAVNTWATILSDIKEKEIKRIEFNTYATGVCVLTRVDGGNSVCYQFASTGVYKYLNGSTAYVTSFPHSYGSTNEIKVSIHFKGTKNIVKINDVILFEDNLTTYNYGVIGFSSYDKQPVDITNLKIALADKLILKNPTTNQHYSLAEKTLIPLPNASDKNMILHGIEAGKEIQLDEDFNKLVQISPSENREQLTTAPPFNGYVYKTKISHFIKKIKIR